MKGPFIVVRILSALVCVVVGLPLGVSGAEPPVSLAELRQQFQDTVDRYERRLTELHQRLEAVEGQVAGGPPQEGLSLESDTRLVDLEDELAFLQTEMTTMSQATLNRLTLSLYTTVEFESFQQASSVFDARSVELLLGASLTDRLKTFMEIEFERTAQTSAGPRQGQVEVEQGWIEYVIADSFVPRFGVVLVPFGRFNLDHFDPMRDLTDRPIVVRRIIPTTWAEAGAGFTGTLFPGEFLNSSWIEDFTIAYQLYVLNGLTNRMSDTSMRAARGAFGSDNNANKAVAGRIEWGLMPGIEIGTSGYAGTYDSQGHTISGVDVDWKLWRGPWEFIGEFAWFWLQAGGMQSTVPLLTVPGTLSGGYVQANYHFWFDILNKTFLGERFESPTLTGVVRYGHARIADDSDAGLGPNKEERVTVGLNYRPVESVVFKLEYQFNNTWNEPLERGDADGLITSVTGAF